MQPFCLVFLILDTNLCLHNVYQDIKNVQDLFYDLIEPLLDESRAQQSLKKNLTQIQIEVESLRLKEPATFQDVTLKVLGKIFKTDVFSSRNLKLVIGDVVVGTSTNTNWQGFIYTFQSSFSYNSSILDSSWVNILKSCRIYSHSNHITFIIMFSDMLCCCTNWSLSICPHPFESTSKDNWDDNIQPIGLSVQLLFSL